MLPQLVPRIWHRLAVALGAATLVALCPFGSWADSPTTGATPAVRGQRQVHVLRNPRRGVRAQNGDDWPEFRYDDQRTGNNPYQTTITAANVATLKPKWTHTTNGIALYTNAVVEGGVVYQGDAYDLYAWQLSNGATLWQISNGLAFHDAPAYYQGTLYVGTHSYGRTSTASFFALDATTGSTVWQYSNFPSYVTFSSSPLVSNGLVYVGTATRFENLAECDTGDQLIAFNSSAPTIASSLTLNPSPAHVGADIWSTPLVDASGNLYVATGNQCGKKGAQRPFPYANAMLALTPGMPKMGVQWAFQIPSGPGHDRDFGATPLLVSGMLIDGSKDGYTYAVNATTGALVWSAATGGVIGSPATDGTNVYVPVYRSTTLCGSGLAPCGALVALNVATGNIVWSIPTKISAHYGVLSAPAVSSGVVFAAYNDAIWALDASTGNVLWTYPTPGQATREGLTVVNGGLLVGEAGPNSTFFCFTPNGS